MDRRQRQGHGRPDRAHRVYRVGRRSRLQPGILPLSLLAFDLFALSLLFAGCGAPELPARWKDREILIDGDYRDWEGALYHFEDEKVYAGVLRDATHLYLCLSSSDRMRIQQVVRGGLTVWFDPSAKQTRTFGLRFPVGWETAVERQQQSGPPPETPPDAPASAPSRVPGRVPEGGGGIDVRTALSEMTGEDRQIEIRRDTGPPRRLFLAEASGIDIQIGLVGDVLTCELRIPLRSKPEFAYALHDAPLNKLAIGVETPGGPARMMDDGGGSSLETPRPGGDGDGQRGGPPGGRGGGRGSRGEGRGRGPGGGPPGSGGMNRPQPTGPLELWFKLKGIGDSKE